MKKSGGSWSNSLNRIFRRVPVVAAWVFTLAAVLGAGLPAIAAEGTNEGEEGLSVAVRPGQTDMGGDVLNGGFSSVSDSTAERLIKEGAAGGRTQGPAYQPRLAQFQVPRQVPEGVGTPSEKRAREEIAKLPAALKFQYAYGSDSELTYLRNPDLNRKVKDDFVFLAPTLFGLATYRPSSWLEATGEMTLEVPIVLKEEDVIFLPDGTIQRKQTRHVSLLVDQAYVTFKGMGPFDLSLGRRNFEDERLFLYDAALDAALLKLKVGHFQAEASVSRENWVDGELLFNPPTGSINNYMLYMEYRGIVDNKLAAYAILRDDQAKLEGKPLYLGVRAYGRPTNRFNYWIELPFVRGKDELGAWLKGYGFDVGFTYRFPDFPLQPSITLGVAFGSGDDNPNDGTNRELRQTGLQSNEGRFGGVTQFKRFGEFLDPELSNLWIYTAGVSFRLAGNAFLDLVYHYYRLNKIADQLRSSGVTALMAQDDAHLSKKVGNEIDIILGFRNLFGLRRFGFEVRAGLFLPGDAFRLEEGDPDNPTFRRADPGISGLAVFIW